MQELNIDYGPTPFRFFHSWFNLDSFDKMAEDTWKSLTTADSNELNDINFTDSLEGAQKSKVRWAIEGDENTKFFHGILNSKRSQLAIRGTLVDGKWIVDPLAVKIVFLKYFSTQFTNRYWKLLKHDIVADIKEFFTSGTFPLGCNSSFIALIPKIHDAKVVKDYRPISLIGSLYKIIAKILANRLSFVISGLISDVQSAFVSNCQILGGPFILNEILSWFKHKKFKAMVFKVDFEKAFDSIRWDYLQDILKMFGFGDKWCGWINGCLNSAMGSVLINGSPTSEFQFHKGLFSGIVTRQEEVNAAATTMGCSIFTTPFVHLGVKVGGVMSRIKSWDDVVAKVSSRLSKWRLKTLSIVPSGVLKLLESIRRNFSNGVDKSERKMAWVSWNKVLASKKYGGLGVSTIYGEDGALNSSSSLSKRSPWLDIIRPMRWWELEDIDLASYDDWLLWLNSSRLSKRLKEFLEGVYYVK
ncbi:RNA-directed DNA polymerase, eukaryota [Tanacetum coccineum]